jgi:hypothetical protein
MRRARHLLAASMLAPLVAIFGPGCEVLIDGNLGSIHCEAEGAFGPPACPDGDVCKESVCVAAPPDVLGVACTEDSICGDGAFCFLPDRYGIVGDSVCTRACCTSSDCDPRSDWVCWVPSNGDGNFCRPADEVGRGPTSTLLAGDLCDEGSQCRSGICTSGVCVDTCCSDTNCASAGARCVLAPGVGPEATWTCGKLPPMRKQSFDLCESDSDCLFGLCTSIDGTSRCAPPCCASNGCDGPVGQSAFACTEIDHQGVTVRACALVVEPSAKGEVGDPCESDGACRSAQCRRDDPNAAGYCTDVCCTDESCGDPDRFACRPRSLSGAWALRCELK